MAASVEGPSSAAVEDEQQQQQQQQQQAAVEGVSNADANGAGAEQDPEARYRFDEELLIKVKGKVRRPAKPDEAERNLAIDKLKAEIERRSARIKEIKELQENSRSTRAAGQQGNQEIMRRLQGLRAEFQTVLRQKQHIREELQQAIKQKEELRAASRSLKDRLPKGVTAETLDAKIRELEHKQAHEGLSGEEEKQTLKRISELSAAKPQYRELADVDGKLKAVEERRAEIQHRLQQCDAVLTDVKAREEVERQALEQSRSKQADGDLDYPALNVEKKEAWDIIQALRAKMDEIRKDFNEKYQEYIKLDKNYNNYIRTQKRKEYEDRQKARAERDAAENGTGEGEAGAPGSAGGADVAVSEAYAAEVLTLDQLVTYLRKLLPADAQAVTQQEQKEVEVPKGFKLLKKEEDMGFMTVAKKKPQAGKKGAAPAAAAPAAAASSSAAAAEPQVRSKKLNHSLDTLKTCMQLGIEVPQTTAELASTIEKAAAKKEYYLELRRTGKKHVPPQPAAPPAAAPEPAKKEEEVVAEAAPEAAPAPEAEAAPAAVEEPKAAAAAPASVEEPAAAPAVVEEAVEEDEPAVSSVSKAEDVADVEPTVTVAVAAVDSAADKSEPKKEAVVAVVAPAAQSGLGVSLAVDSLTEAVSIKLSVGSD